MSADLDREIDRAVRSLLDAEPTASFRARVLASTDARRRRTRVAASIIPVVVVAAAVVLAIVVAPMLRTQRPPDAIAGREVHLPALVIQVAVPRQASEVPVTPAVSTETARAPRRMSRPAVANGEPAAAGIDALAAPAPLSIDTLAPPPPSFLPSIQPAPLRVTALDLPALETPSDAARGVDR
jgi:hypothetical protein